MWSVPNQTMEGGIHLNPMVSAHLHIPLISGRGTGTETCVIGSVFPPDDLWIDLDTYTNCTVIYDFLLKVWLMGCATAFICIDWWGKGWPIVTSPFRQALSYTGCCQYLLNMNCLMHGLLFLQLSTSLGCFCPPTFFWKADWTGCHRPPLCHIYILTMILISRINLYLIFCLQYLGSWMDHLYGGTQVLRWHRISIHFSFAGSVSLI